MVLAVKAPTTTPDVTLTPSPTGLTVTLEPWPNDRARGAGDTAQ
jgi:hypothetical protein